jgi:hypothetical protein
MRNPSLSNVAITCMRMPPIDFERLTITGISNAYAWIWMQAKHTVWCNVLCTSEMSLLGFHAVPMRANSVSDHSVQKDDRRFVRCPFGQTTIV